MQHTVHVSYLEGDDCLWLLAFLAVKIAGCKRGEWTTPARRLQRRNEKNCYHNKKKTIRETNQTQTMPPSLQIDNQRLTVYSNLDDGTKLSTLSFLSTDDTPFVQFAAGNNGSAIRVTNLAIPVLNSDRPVNPPGRTARFGCNEQGVRGLRRSRLGRQKPRSGTVDLEYHTRGVSIRRVREHPAVC